MVDLVGIGMTSARRQMVTLSYGTIECPKLGHSYLKQKTSAQVLQQFDSIVTCVDKTHVDLPLCAKSVS